MLILIPNSSLSLYLQTGKLIFGYFDADFGLSVTSTYRTFFFNFCSFSHSLLTFLHYLVFPNLQFLKHHSPLSLLSPNVSIICTNSSPLMVSLVFRECSCRDLYKLNLQLNFHPSKFKKQWPYTTAICG